MERCGLGLAKRGMGLEAIGDGSTLTGLRHWGPSDQELGPSARTSQVYEAPVHSTSTSFPADDRYAGLVLTLSTRKTDREIEKHMSRAEPDCPPWEPTSVAVLTTNMVNSVQELMLALSLRP